MDGNFWLLAQLADSAFPAGGFAHSGGLEAAVQLGEVEGSDGARRYAEEVVWREARLLLPVVGAAWDAGLGGVARVDARVDAILTSDVAARASKAQGRAFVSACARAFGVPEIAALDDALRVKSLVGHHAVVFGAIARVLGIARVEAQRLFLFAQLRAVLSAAVRLGKIGPLEAQSVQHALGPVCERALGEVRGLALDDAAQTAPLHELWGALHDRLYSRLFQS
jgi:urease accessory protein